MTEQELLAELMRFVKDASPILWAAATRQVYMQMIYGGLLLSVWLTILLGCIAVARAALKSGGEDGLIAAVFLMLPGAGAVIAISIVIGDIFARLFNPQYYAIRILLELVK